MEEAEKIIKDFEKIEMSKNNSKKMHEATRLIQGKGKNQTFN